MLRFFAVTCLCTLAALTSPAFAEPSQTTDTATPAAARPSVEHAGDNTGSPAIADQADAKSVPVNSAAPVISEPAKAAASVEEKPAPPPPPAITLTAAVDLATQTIVVSENGAAKYTWPISSGTQEHPTPRGTFHPQWMAKMWYSRQYDNAPMPNAVFINGGVAIHATPYTRSLGRPASHGCIRLAPTNAKTFYNLVQKHGLKHTKVSVYGTPKWSAPAVASRGSDRRYAARTYDGGYGNRIVVSAYDQGFTQRSNYRSGPSYYTYPGDAPRVYRRYRGNRYVTNQRAPRRVYYYNGYGYGW